ncbi:MAG TPA: class I SAM-dependent methyltransferase, partial [Thermopetrobacter sp.]|nr:class I SAM-dependent methyltransferase [Thermopetrobacter sp.]
MSGVGQRWSPETYDRHARFVTEAAEEILSWLDARPGERILDLGCGDGVIAERLMRAGCQVVGVDISSEMLEAARARGVQVVRASGEDLPFEREFDAVFSNAALHWMTDARAVLAGVT